MAGGGVQVADLRQQLGAREAEMGALIDGINSASHPPSAAAGGFDSDDVAAAAADASPGEVEAARGGGGAGSEQRREGAAEGVGPEGVPRQGRETEAEGEGGRVSVGKAVQWLLNKLPRPWGK